MIEQTDKNILTQTMVHADTQLFSKQKKKLKENNRKGKEVNQRERHKRRRIKKTHTHGGKY